MPICILRLVSRVAFKVVSLELPVIARRRYTHHWCNKVYTSLIERQQNSSKMPDIEQILAPLRAEVQAQGDVVRRLKAEKASDLAIKSAVAQLKAMKKVLEDKVRS